MKFTIEKEIDNKLAFLDISMYKNNEKQSAETKVYRKQMFTPSIIPAHTTQL